MPGPRALAQGTRVVEQARQAWRRLALMIPLAVGVFVLYGHRRELFGTDVPVRIAAGIALLILGWASARAAGSAVTAIILGLVAQQTIGNLFAGIVLLSARPFRVGERVRLQGVASDAGR